MLSRIGYEYSEGHVTLSVTPTAHGYDLWYRHDGIGLVDNFSAVCDELFRRYHLDTMAAQGAPLFGKPRQ